MGMASIIIAVIATAVIAAAIIATVITIVISVSVVTVVSVVACRAISVAIIIASLPQFLYRQGVVIVAVRLAEQPFRASPAEFRDQLVTTQHPIAICVNGSETRTLGMRLRRKGDAQAHAQRQPHRKTMQPMDRFGAVV